MKALIAFVAGALVAAGTAFYIMTRDQPVETPVVSEALVEEPAVATETADLAEQPAPAVSIAEEPAAPPPAPVVKKPVTKVARKPQPTPVAAPPEAPPPPPPAKLPPPPQVETAAARPEPPPAVLAEVAEQPPPPPEPKRFTLEAGALLTIRLAEDLSSEKNVSGDAFEATLDQPLIIDGYVIAERGARAEGRVVAAQRAGRVKGAAVIGLQLVRFNTSDGQKVTVSTDTFEKKVSTNRKREAVKVGAAAAIGAAIGAIAGGGKGAAIGAAVGGAAGTGSVLATRGDPADLRVETRITFRLSAPVTITEKL